MFSCMEKRNYKTEYSLLSSLFSGLGILAYQILWVIQFQIIYIYIYIYSDGHDVQKGIVLSEKLV